MAKVEKRRFSERGIVSQVPAKRISVDTATASNRMFVDVGEELGNLAQTLENAHTLAEETKANNHIIKRLAEIKANAALETDLSDEKVKQYKSDIDNAYKEGANFITLPGRRNSFVARNEAAPTIDKIEVSNIFHKKFKDDALASFVEYQGFLGENYINGNQAIKNRSQLELETSLDLQVSAGYKTKQQAALDKVNIVKNWKLAEVERKVYTDPERFLFEEAQGMFSDTVDPKTMESLRNTAGKMIEKRAEEQKEIINQASDVNEAGLAKLIVDGKEDEAIVKAQTMVNNLNTPITEKNFNLIKFANTSKNADPGKSDAATIDSLLTKYSTIRNTQDKMDFRNKVLINKRELDEKWYKTLLAWSADDQYIPEEKLGVLDTILKYAGVVGSAIKNSNPLYNTYQIASKMIEIARDPRIKLNEMQEKAQELVVQEQVENNPLKAKYNLKDTVNVNGIDYEVTGFADDGTPLMDIKK